MSKTIGIRMGTNLGFIKKVVLVDGTVLENMHVLYNAPIPTDEQCELILRSTNEVSRHILGVATNEWSQYPELMADHRIFREVQ